MLTTSAKGQHDHHQLLLHAQHQRHGPHQQGQQIDENATSTALRGEPNNGSSLGCSTSPETAPPYEDDGADGRIDSLFREMMAQIDEEDGTECLGGEKHRERQRRQHQQEEEGMEKEGMEEGQEEELISSTSSTFGSATPLQAAFMDEPFAEAFEGAMALSKRMETSTKEAFANACTVAVQNQAVVEGEWKKVTSALYHSNITLTADKAKIAGCYSKLEAQHIVLEKKIQALEATAAGEKAEHDRGASELKEPWEASPPGPTSMSKIFDSSSGASAPSVASSFNVLAPVCCPAAPIPVAITAMTKAMATKTAQPPSEDCPMPVVITDAATATGAATATAPATITQQAIDKTNDCKPKEVADFKGRVSSPPVGSSILAYIADVAASAERVSTTAARTSTTTGMMVSPQPDDLSTPSSPAMFASSAAAEEPLQVKTKHTDEATTTTEELPSAERRSPSTLTIPTTTATAVAPTSPPAPAATISAAPTPPLSPATATTAAPSPPPAPSVAIAAVFTTVDASAAPGTTAAVRTTSAAFTATPKRTSLNDKETKIPQHGRGVRVSHCKTGGWSGWFEAGVGSTVLSAPGVSSGERPDSSPRLSSSMARTPLGTVAINTTPHSVLADRLRSTKGVACVGTPTLKLETGVSRVGDFGGGAGGVSRAIVTRRNDGGVASVEGGGAKESRRAPVTGPTLSSKAAARPTPIVATRRGVSQQRPSTRSQLADHEKTDGMARRLRSAGKSTREDAPVVIAAGQRKVASTGAGVVSRTRQAAAAAARGGANVVVKRRWA